MKIGLSPKVNITSVTHDFSDYTIRSHVMRPIVLMVAGFAIAIFAGIIFSIVQGMVWGTASRRTHRVVVNERELKLSPIHHLMKLANKIIKSNRRLDLKISFLKDNGKQVPSIGRALKRQYFTDIFEGIKKHYSTGENSGFLLYKTKTNELLIPQSEPPKGSEQETSSIYYAIGAVMMYVFFNKENYLIGQVFHPSIFSAIISLTDEEINLPYERLTNETKLKMLEALILAQIDAGENLRHLLAALPFLQKKEEATDGEIEDLTSFYGSAFEIVEVEDIQQNKFLLLDERTKNDGQQLSYVLPDYRLNIPVIRANMDEFHDFCLTRLLNAHVDSLGTLRLTLYPIHTMAKAMMRLAGDHWSKQIRFSSDAASASSSSIPHSLVEVGNRLNCKIQGELDRRVLISKVVLETESPIVLRQWLWMREWILDENTPTSKVEGLLIFWSGSPSIDWEKQKHLYIGGHSEGIDLGAGGCSFRLMLPKRDYDVNNSYAPGDTNMTKEGFFKFLDQASMDRGWTKV